MTYSASSTYEATSSAAYELFLGRWTRRLAEQVIDVADLRDREGDVLDVGCGTGSLAMAMARRFPRRRVIGLDIAEPYLAFAHAQSHKPMRGFVQGDATALPWSDGQFAATFALLVLMFIPAAETAVRQMRRVTRSGGVIVGAVWDFRGGLVYQRMFWDTAVAFDPSAAALRADDQTGAPGARHCHARSRARTLPRLRKIHVEAEDRVFGLTTSPCGSPPNCRPVHTVTSSLVRMC